MRQIRVLVLGFVLSEELFQGLVESDPGMPTQTQRFGVDLIRALRSGGAEVSLASTWPATSYPNGPSFRYRGGTMTVEGVEGITLGFLNVPVLKHLTRGFAAFRHVPAQLRGRGVEALLIHGVHSPWLLFGAFASRWLRTPAVAVLTDPPNVTHQFDTGLTRALKCVDQLLVKTLLCRIDGVVAVTSDLAEDFAPGRPFMVMEGLVSDAALESFGSESFAPDPIDGIREDERPLVVYAGGLSAEYGVQLLVEAHALNPDRFRLAIAGRGPMESELRRCSVEHRNLQFLGMLNRSELAHLYASADVLVNPRPPGQGFTRYSFPSKILEYLVAGRPVVSMELEGIPEEYRDILHWAEASAAGLYAALELAFAEHADVTRRRAAAAEALVRSKSASAQGRRLVSFLAAILDAEEMITNPESVKSVETSVVRRSV